MKKILFAVVAAGLMSVSAMAATVGKVHTVQIDSQGLVKVKLIRDDTTITTALPLVGQDIQAMLAMILTAKSSDSYVSGSVQNIDGIKGWGLIILQ